MTSGLEIGRYRLTHRLGEGGFGEVYLAQQIGDDGFGRPVAIKRLRRDEAFDSEGRERLHHEALLGPHLEHPNLIRVLDYVRVGEDAHLVMEVVRGIDLRRLLAGLEATDTTLPLGVVLEIGVQLLCGLSFAHQARGDDGVPLHLVHRDVTPANLMVDETGFLKILDFGIASSILKKDLTRQAGAPGTRAYMSPQRCERQPEARKPTQSDDLFSVGAVLFELATGDLLFAPDRRGTTPRNTFVDGAGGVIDLLPEAARPLGPLLASLLAEDPAKRPTSAAAVEAELERLRGEEAGTERLRDLAALLLGDRDRVEGSDAWRHLRSGVLESPGAWRTTATPVPLHAGTTMPPPGRAPVRRRNRRWAVGAPVLLALGVLAVIGPAWRAQQKTIVGPPVLPKMVRIEPGTYRMGATDPADAIANAADGENSDEQTPWSVVLDFPVDVGVTEVTQREFASVMGYNPSFFKTGDLDRPLECVTFSEAAAYANLLSARVGEAPCYKVDCDITEVRGQPCLEPQRPDDFPAVARESERPGNLANTCAVTLAMQTGECRGFRLPYEEEWEFFARAGTETSTPWGTLELLDDGPFVGRLRSGADEPLTDINDVAVHAGNSPLEQGTPCFGLSRLPSPPPQGRCGPAAVGTKVANAWGLLDVLGNVSELTQTMYGTNGPDYLPGEVLYPHRGGRQSTYRPSATPLVARGGSWFKSVKRVRSSQRIRGDRGAAGAHIGLRMVRTIREPEDPPGPSPG